MNDRKTVLINALNDSQRKPKGIGFEDCGHIIRMDVDMDGFDGWQEWNSTELATAVRDHFLDREKVRGE